MKKLTVTYLDHRSHVLSDTELVDVVHKLDLMSVDKLKIHPLHEEFEVSI